MIPIQTMEHPVLVTADIVTVFLLTQNYGIESTRLLALQAVLFFASRRATFIMHAEDQVSILDVT